MSWKIKTNKKNCIYLKNYLRNWEDEGVEVCIHEENKADIGSRTCSEENCPIKV